MTISVEYNINGIGNIDTYIYGIAEKLFLDEKINIEERLKKINQLGAIKYLHPGANFTRYEYVLLQIKLVNLVKENKTVNLGLGSEVNKRKFNTEFLDGKITNAEIILFTIICANIGHFNDTFSANKVWLNFINEIKNKKIFLKQFNDEEKIVIDKILKTNDYYKIQWLNTLFLFIYYKKEEYRKLWFRIINLLLSNEIHIIKDIYNKVREISYLVLDSNFSHTPISINLPLLVLNENYFVQEMAQSNSELLPMFKRMDKLLEDILYMDNNVLLMSSFRSNQLKQKLNQMYSKTNLTKRKIYKIINDDESPFNVELEFDKRNIVWDKKKNLSITIKNSEVIRGLNINSEEEKLQNKVGSNIFIGGMKNPDNTRCRFVYSKKSNDKKISSTLKINKTSLDYLKNLEKVNNCKLIDSIILKKHITYLLRNLLNEDYYIEYNYFDKDSVIFEKGKRNTLNVMQEHIDKYKQLLNHNEDTLHEMKSIVKYIDEIKYKGIFIIFLGSIRLINSKKVTVCELDGIIYMPNHKRFLTIVESKNISKSSIFTTAKKQLNDGIVNLVDENCNINKKIIEIENYGAALELAKN